MVPSPAPVGQVPKPAIVPLVALLLAGGAAPLAAQEVSIELRVTLLSAGGTPLDDAFVQLRSQSADVLQSRFTNAGGVVSFVIGEGGRFRALVRQFGQADWESPELDLRAGRDTAIAFTVPIQPLALEEIGVSSRGKCGAPGGHGAELVRRYELMKTSFASIIQLQNSGISFAGQLVRNRFGRRPYSDQPRRLVWPDTVQVRVAQPLVSPSPDSVLELGFAERSELDGTARFFAPTPEILASDQFLLSHCFGLSEDSDASLVGLTFRPLSGNQIVDVEGTVWLQRSSGAVAKVEFAFTRVIEFLGADIPRVLQEARERYPNAALRFNGITPFNVERIRGEVEFTELPDGRSVLKRWQVASPYLDYTVRTEARRGIDVIGQIRPLLTTFDVFAVTGRPESAPRSTGADAKWPSGSM